MFKKDNRMTVIVNTDEVTTTTFLTRSETKTMKRTKRYLKYFVEKRGDLFEEKGNKIIITSKKESQIFYEGMIKEALMK